jgi:TolA-binding protein
MRPPRLRRLRHPAVAIVALVVTGVASGCGGTKAAREAPTSGDPTVLRQDVDRLRADLGELRTRVEAVQRAGMAHADRVAVETRTEFDAVKKAIEASARNDTQRQTEALDGQAKRLDLLERRVSELDQTLRRVEAGLAGIERQLARVPESSAPAPAPAPAARGSSPTRPPARSPGSRSTGEPVPSGSPAGPKPAPSVTGTPTARAIYDRAMESWNKGEQGQAVLDFEELVKRFPSDPLVAPAQFRIGEAYFTARDFNRAAAGYRKAVELAPKGKDTPQALLRLGLAYRAQKRESDARQAWNQLVRDFPESEFTEEARRALRGR